MTGGNASVTYNLASGSGSQDGDLVISDAISVSSGNARTLTLTAARGISGSANIENVGTVIFENYGTSDNTYSGVISGGSNFQKTGTGTMILSGVNSFTGTTTVSEGTLNVTGTLSDSTDVSVASGATYDVDASDTVASVSGAGTVDLASGITLTTGDAGDDTISGAVQGAGVLSKAGAGTLTLSGSNASFTGGVTLGAGTLSLGSANAIGSSGTITFSGGTLQASASNTTDYSSRFSTGASQAYKFDTNGQSVTLATDLTSSGGTFAKTGTGTLTLSGTNTYSGATTVTAGTLALTGTGSLASSSKVVATGTFDISGTTSGASIVSLDGAGTVTLGSKALTLTAANNTFSGAIGGTGGVTLSSGTQTLSGTNTYSGATTVSGGTLNVTGTLSDSTDVSVASGATYDVDASDTVASVSGAGTGDLASGITLTTGDAGDDTISGAVQGAGVLSKAGAGTLTLSGSNASFTGGVTLGAGTLSLGSANAIGSSGTITFSGGTLQASASNTTDYSSRFSTGASQAYKFDTNGQSVTLATDLTSSGGTFAKTGTGTLTLSEQTPSVVRRRFPTAP